MLRGYKQLWGQRSLRGHFWYNIEKSQISLKMLLLSQFYMQWTWNLGKWTSSSRCFKVINNFKVKGHTEVKTLKSDFTRSATFSINYMLCFTSFKWTNLSQCWKITKLRSSSFGSLVKWQTFIEIKLTLNSYWNMHAAQICLSLICF